MNILLNIDKQGYKDKPSKYAAAISNRTRYAGAQKEIEPAQLLSFIERGYTFTPAAIGGTWEETTAKDNRGKALHKTAEFWKSQQVIVADIDNTHNIEIQDENGEKKKESVINARQLTPAEALQACRDAGIDPYCIYKTFSYTPWHEKYRVLLVLEKPITDFASAADLIGRFAQLFDTANETACRAAGLEPEPCADPSIEPVKLIFGGRNDCIMYRSESLTNIDALQALPEKRENAPKTASNKKSVSDTKKTSKATSAAYNDRLEQLEATLEQDKLNFDLLSYIEHTTESRMHGGYINPCPICGHNDCLSLDPGGAAFYCHSSSHEQGGGIIDYLMQKHDISMPKAFEMFKFDIMGYDRREWSSAYAERKSAEEAGTMPGIEEIKADFEEIQAEKDQGHAASLEEPANMASLEKEAPRSSTQGNGSGTATAEKIINAAEYINKIYDADIKELQQYADRKMNMHPDIDKYLTLYPGLAVLGGQASLGKTTFCVNMALKLLEHQEHVLYFALEQRAEELVTKALTCSLANHNPALKVQNSWLYEGIKTPAIDAAINDAAARLADLNIIESDFETTAADITETVDKYMRENAGQKPIVIVDYLQLIAPPENFRGDNRASVDANLKALKKMQKERGLFVLVVSSFNRSSNYEPISYESFKESGGIEYTCDYVFGLQLTIQDMNNDAFYTKYDKERPQHEKKKLIQEAQRQDPKRVEFVALKNRRRQQSFAACFNYYPYYDLFQVNEKGLEEYTGHTTPKAEKIPPKAGRKAPQK